MSEYSHSNENFDYEDDNDNKAFVTEQWTEQDYIPEFSVNPAEKAFNRAINYLIEEISDPNGLIADESFPTYVLAAQTEAYDSFDTTFQRHIHIMYRISQLYPQQAEMIETIMNWPNLSED